jgi:hypothetical protein
MGKYPTSKSWHILATFRYPYHRSDPPSALLIAAAPCLVNPVCISLHPCLATIVLTKPPFSPTHPEAVLTQAKKRTYKAYSTGAVECLFWSRNGSIFPLSGFDQHAETPGLRASAEFCFVLWGLFLPSFLSFVSVRH